MASLPPWLDEKFYLADGTTPNAGGKIFTYEAGTTTKKQTLKSESGGANPNPIIANSAGEFDMWLESGAYKIVNAPANDTDPPIAAIKTWDDVNSGAGAQGTRDTIAELKGLDEGIFDTVQVLGYNTVGDGGGGLFRWDDTSTTAENGGTIFTPTVSDGTGRWFRVYDGALNSAWWGTTGDGVAVEDTAFANANTFAASTKQDLYIPASSAGYLITTTLTFSAGVRVLMSEGAFFTASGATSLVFNGHFEAGFTKTFDLNIAVTFATGSIKEAYPQWWGTVGDGVTIDTVTISKAETACVAGGGIDLFFPAGSYKLDTNIEFGTEAIPVKVVMNSIAQFTSSTSVTLTFNRFDGQISTHFAGNITASFNKNSFAECYPQWWGAVCDGTTDDAPAIQAAFDAMPDYTTMRFPLAEITNLVSTSLYYKIDSTIEISNKEGCRFIFSGKGDTAVSAVSTYPIRYEGSALITYENPVFREVGNNYCYFEGLGIDAGGSAEFGAWFSGINAYPRFPSSGNADTIDSTTVGDITVNNIQSTAHEFSTGDTVVYNNGGGTSIAGLTSTNTYFVIRTSANEYSLSLTLAGAVGFTKSIITISDGVGVLHTFTWQAKTLTSVFNRSVGCIITQFRAIGLTVCGAQVGEANSTALGSSQTDIGSFNNSYFSAPEASIQIPLDAEPGSEHPDIPGQAVTFGLHVIGPNTVVVFNQIESTGDWSTNITSGSVNITGTLFLGDSALFINDRTSYVNVTAFHTEGLKGRAVLTGSSDGAGARDISIYNGIMLPSSKDAVTIPTGDVDLGTDTITATSHEFVTGDRLFYEDNGGTSIAGLTDETLFHCIKVNANSFQVANSIDDANAGTQIDLTGTGNNAQTFTWKPAPLRFRSNQNVTLNAIEAEDWISDNAGSVGNKAVIFDAGCNWLNPTDHSNNPDLKAFRYSVKVSGAVQDQLLYIPGLKKQLVDESGGPKTLSAGWSDADVKGVEGTSGNTITLHSAFKGMFVRVWKAGIGELIVAQPLAYLFMTIPTSAVTIGTDTITETAHGYTTGQTLYYEANGGTVLTGLADATAFYCIRTDDNDFQLATTLVNAQSSTQIDLTGTGNNAQTFRNTTVTTDINDSTETITFITHTFSTGDRISYNDNGGTAVAGLNNSTVYFCIKIDADSFKLATTLANAKAGTAIDLTGTGSDAQIFNKSSGFIVRHDTDELPQNKVRADSAIENGHILFTCIDEGEWRISPQGLTLRYDDGNEYLTATAMWDPGSLATLTETSTTIPVIGAVTTDFVQVSHDQILTTNQEISGAVDSADQVTVTLSNPTSGTVNLGDGTLSVKVTRTNFP